MIATIKTSAVSGTILAPTSKSSMQRACAAALLASGKSVIHNPGKSNDDLAAIELIKNLGADVVYSGEDMIVNSPEVYPSSSPRTGQREINCGESGLGIRMFTPIIALSGEEITINGEGSLLNRPMDFFDRVLPALGVSITSNDGKLPIKVRGPLKPASIEIDASLSSQFLTGLLMAFAAADASSVTIKVSKLSSKPYIDLTLDVLRRFGLKLPENRNYQEFVFGENSHHPSMITREYTVEGDWSGGAFLLVAGAIAGPVTVRGLDMMSTQADKALMNALSAAHASYAIEAKGIKIRPGEMQGFEFDASECPDLFPPLIALAAYCKGETRIKGARRLVHKESNRAASLQDEFSKFGVSIKIDDDTMTIHGGLPLKGTRVHSHHDHRIAMACAVAALKAGGETVIDDAEAVKKSYPGFFEDLKTLGAAVSLDSTIRFS